MIKFSIKAVIFSIIVFILVLCSGKLFLFEWMPKFKGRDYKSIIQKTGVDIVFFGTSHGQCSYDPRVFENELNVNVFNYGLGNQRLISCMPMINEIINEQKIKIGIVDIFELGVKKIPPKPAKDMSYQYQTLDNVDLSLDKIKTHNKIYGKKNLLDIFPMVRNHSIWYKRVFQTKYFLESQDDYYKGFWTKISFDEKRWKKSKENKKEYYPQKIVEKYKLTKKQKSDINEIVDLFKNKNIPLLFVSGPIHRRYMNNKFYTYQKRIKEYLKEINVPYIDYNDLWDELNLHQYDFRDITHLNTGGALKVSQHLAKYIKKQYNINSDDFINKEFLFANRYSVLENPNEENTIAYKKIEYTKIKNQTGVDEIIIYKDNYERLEILLVGKKLKDISIKVEYDLQNFMDRNVAKEIRKKIKKGKYTLKEFLPNKKKGGLYNGYNFKGKEFKAIIVDCPFMEISNLNILIGKRMPKTSILKIKHLELK